MSCEEILQKIVLLKSPETAKIADDYLTSILDLPSTLINLLYIFKNQNDPSIRQYAAVLAKRSLEKTEKILTPEQKNIFQFTLIQLIQEVRNDNSIYCLMDLAVHCLTSINPNWQEFWSLINNILQDQNSVPLSLYIWKNIIVNCQRINPQFILHDFAIRFNPIIECCMQATDSELASSILDFIQVLYDSFCDCEIPWPPALPQLFIGLFDREVGQNAENPNIDLIKKLFTTFAFLIENGFPPFDVISTEIVQRILAVSANVNLNLYVRAAIQPLVTIIPWYMPEAITNIAEFLQPPFEVATALCREGDDDIEFIADLLRSITGNVEGSGDDVLSMLQVILQTGLNSNDGPSLLVAMTAINGAIENYGHDLETHSSEIMAAIGVALQSEAQPLFEVGCRLLESCSKFCPETYSSTFDEIVASLMQQIARPKALVTLDKVMFNSKKAPSNYIEIIQHLSSFLNSGDIPLQDAILSCLTSTLSQVNEENPEIYTGMREFLSAIFSAPPDNPVADLKGKAFELLGYLVKIAPKVVEADLGGIMQVLVATFGINDEINEYLALCISKIVGVLPLSLAPIIPDILNKFFELLAREEPGLEEEDNHESAEEDEEDEEDERVTPFSRMQSTVLQAIGSIIAEIPFSVDPTKSWIANGQGQHAVERFMIFLLNPSFHVQTAAAYGLFFAGDGIPHLVQPQTMKEMIGQLMIKMQKITDQDELAKNIMLAMGNLCVHAAASFTDQELSDAISFFTSGFQKKISALMEDKNYSETVFEHFVYALRMLILFSGHRPPNILQEFFNCIQELLRNGRLMYKAYAFHTLCVLSFVYPESAEITRIAQSHIEGFMKRENETIKNITFAGLSFLAASNNANALFNVQQANSLIQAALAIVSADHSETLKSTAANMACMFISKFGGTSQFMQFLPPPIDDDDIPFAARFAFFAQNTWPNDPAIIECIKRISINVLSSGDWLIKLVPPDVLQWLAQVASTIPEEGVAVQLKSNQHAILQFNRNKAGRP